MSTVSPGGFPNVVVPVEPGLTLNDRLAAVPSLRCVYVNVLLMIVALLPAEMLKVYVPVASRLPVPLIDHPMGSFTYEPAYGDSL